MPPAPRERERGGQHSGPVQADGPGGHGHQRGHDDGRDRTDHDHRPGPPRIDTRPEHGEPEADKAGQNNNIGQGEIRQEPATQILLQPSSEQEARLVVSCQHRSGEGEHGLGADLKDGKPEEAQDK
jgi:hypothetical protein